jgi:hypothetical protein
MHGTSFYRYNFSKSQFGSYITYLDERGTAGCCRYQNVKRAFDFVDLGRPAPGSMLGIEAPRVAPMVVAAATVRRRPSLLEAAAAALVAMDVAGVGGPARDNLAFVILVEQEKM